MKRRKEIRKTRRFEMLFEEEEFMTLRNKLGKRSLGAYIRDLIKRDSEDQAKEL